MKNNNSKKENKSDLKNIIGVVTGGQWAECGRGHTSSEPHQYLVSFFFLPVRSPKKWGIWARQLKVKSIVSQLIFNGEKWYEYSSRLFDICQNCDEYDIQ